MHADDVFLSNFNVIVEAQNHKGPLRGHFLLGFFLTCHVEFFNPAQWKHPGPVKSNSMFRTSSAVVKKMLLLFLFKQSHIYFRSFINILLEPWKN